MAPLPRLSFFPPEGEADKGESSRKRGLIVFLELAGGYAVVSGLKVAGAASDVRPKVERLLFAAVDDDGEITFTIHEVFFRIMCNECRVRRVWWVNVGFRNQSAPVAPSKYLLFT